MLQKLNLFIELTRLKRPIGYMLLFWPCLWGLTLAYDFKGDLINFYKYLIFFLLGAILMRSAGCIINDIADRNFDKKVERTKNRPIASGKISIQLALTYSIVLCLFALIVLINFNKLTIILAMCSMPLAFSYPLMKRFTYWPQLFLGITFNYGLILGWTSVNQNVNFLLYTCYLILYISFLSTGILMNFNLAYFGFSLIIFLHLFFYQLKKLNINNPSVCLKLFKSNNFFGFLVFLNILIGKL